MRPDDWPIRFSHAVTRTPAASAVRGLRAVDSGPPDIARLRADHAAYVTALRGAGALVEVLEPAEAFPDSLFVEDTALCLPEGAVILSPGASPRRGEEALMAPVLERFYGSRVVRLPGGHVEGGDVLATGREILVGLSKRTDRQGTQALSDIVAGWGHKLRVVATPASVLHFKTDCSLLAPDVILSTARLAASGCFEDYKVLIVPEGEEPAANLIRVNDVVIMPRGFPATAEMLDQAGFSVVEVSNAQAARLDGGMSCLSLRFTPPGA